MGAGCIIRDHRGIFMVARMHSKVHTFACAQLAEAISLREALSWFKGLNMQKVQVEVDALLIVQVISSSALDNSVFGFIINDCKMLLNEINQCKI